MNRSSVRSQLGALGRLVSLAAVATVALRTVPTSAQQVTFRTAVDTVFVYATVSDGGRLVRDLTRDAFTVLDEGVPVEITQFANTVQPITVVIMLDTSGSMHPHLLLLRRAAMAFTSTFGPDDRARIGSFSTMGVGISARWTRAPEELQRVLREEIWPGTNSPVWIAIDAAMSAMAAETGRRVVLALTDGHNRDSIPGIRTNLKDVRRRAENEGFMVYAIGPPGSHLSPEIRDLAEESGGGYFELAETEDMDAAAARVIAELRHQYFLGFTPRARDGRPHRIEVRARDGELKVRARTSYVAGDRR